MKTAQRQLNTAYGSKPRVLTLVGTEPTMTKQSFKDECNINKIMEKYQKSGLVDHVNEHQANYDFCTGDNFTESMQTVATAQSMFNELPSSTRKYFDNDPAKFYNYVQNPDNQDSLYEMGLAERPPTSLDESLIDEGDAKTPAPSSASPPVAGDGDSVPDPSAA